MTLDPTPFDHLLALALVAGLPLGGLRAWRRLQAALERDDPDARLDAYRRSMARQWALCAVLAVGWAVLGRGGSLLGVEAPSGFLSWAVLVGAALLAAVQLRFVKGLGDRPEAREDIRKQLGGLAPLLPADRRELAWFMAVGVTAGVTEELLFRGFLLAYLAAFVGVWPALVLSSIAFGVAHLYQGGPGSVLKTGAVGFVLGLLYVLSGQLWAPILLHTALDLATGWAAWQAREETPAAG